MLTFIVTGQELIRIDKVNVASLSQKYLKCRFIFDSEWEEITTKTAIFYDSTGNASYKKILENDNTCIADSRALKNGSFTVTVYGTKEDDSEFVITTNKVLVKMNASGFTADSDNTEETNPELIEQIVIKYLNDNAGGAVTPEEIQEAVDKYLDENPIEGAGKMNVQADWNQTDTTADDYIKNKPTVLNGQDGADGRGIVSITKTSSVGLVDVYTITYTDDTTSTFTVTNGKDGDGTGTGGSGADGVGIADISKTSTSGLVDTYTITYTDGNTSTFEVTNGADGANGKSLEFNWDGTKLGVRQEGDSEYVYVDLKGADGNSDYTKEDSQFDTNVKLLNKINRYKLIDTIEKDRNNIVQQGFRDIVIIPDKYNTGLIDSSLLAEVSEAGTFAGLKFAFGDNVLKLSGLSNTNIEDEIIVENLDFVYKITNLNQSGYPTNKHIIFNNCKFKSFDNRAAYLDNKVSFTFNRCEFNGGVIGMNITLNDCHVTGSSSDAFNPMLNFHVNNCYISNLLPEGNTTGAHVDGLQIYGTEYYAGGNITFNNVRMEIPSFYHEGSTAYINAGIMYKLEYGDVTDCSFSDMIINGGGYSVYLEKHDFNQEHLILDNVLIGEARKYGKLYKSSYDENAVVNDLLDNSKLYVSSVWKDDENRTHIICSNDTNSEKTLTVVTNVGEKTFIIPKCYTNNELNDTNKELTFVDMPFDIDCIIEENVDYIICYDGDYKIRFVNFTENDIYYVKETEENEEVEVQESKIINTNNIIPESVLSGLTKDSTVQINGEDTYILSSASVNLYSAAVTDNRKFYVGVWVNEDTYTQYGSELSLNVKKNDDWDYAILSKTISAANTPEYLELEIDLSPDITDFSITLNAANKNIYFNNAIVVEGVAKQEYYYDSEYWSEVQQHNLFNKMIIGFGDSIMQGVGNGKKGFLEKLTTHTLNACGVMNKAIGGATVSYTADTTNSYLMKQITSYFENFDADIAVINGGVNEAWSSSEYALGEISEGYEAELDTTTFAGALEEIFRYFKITKQVNVIYMTTHKITGADGLKKRMDLALQICNKWGIGVIDFYNAGQIIADIGDTVNNMYFYNGDGCHPNDAGYEFLRPQFEAGLLNCGQSTHVDTELYKSSTLRSLTLEPNTLYDLGTLSDTDELELTVNMTTASRTDIFHASFVAGATDQGIILGSSDEVDMAYKGVTEFVVGDTYEISIQNYTIVLS